MKSKLKKFINSKFCKVIIPYFAFWISIIGIFAATAMFALSATGSKFEFYSDFFSDSTMISWNIVLWSYVPLIVTLLILVSAFYMQKKKRSYYDLVKLFFAIELPILLVLFGKIIFSVYSTTILFLGLVIVISSLWLWWNLLFPNKINFLKKYKHLPLVANTILSGWIFAIFAFWIPLIVYGIVFWFIPEFFEDVVGF